MRNIAVMFKGVEPARMSDPGEQLKKVLDFRARLDEEKGLLYTTFDTPVEFERWVRQLLRNGPATTREHRATEFRCRRPTKPPLRPFCWPLVRARRERTYCRAHPTSLTKGGSRRRVSLPQRLS